MSDENYYFCSSIRQDHHPERMGEAAGLELKRLRMKYFWSTEQQHDVITAIIVGSSFDLAYGYATRYSDFIASHYFKDLLCRNKLAQYINVVQEITNWVDMEVEIGNYSRKIGSSDFQRDDI
jgi:hypothetical protein